MVGHATLTAVDAARPASLSGKVVQGIMREQWGHNGLVVTDDLSMGPVVQHGMCAARVDAINAGVDLLLVSYDTDQHFEILYCLATAQREGRLLTQRLDDSDKRLLHLWGTVRPALATKPREAQASTVLTLPMSALALDIPQIALIISTR